MKKKWDVIVVGELNVDLLLNGIDSFPEIGKEKIARQMNLVLGSSSAIFASNLSSLGARVAFAGMIGTDDFGRCVISSLEQKGVDTSLIIQSDQWKTGATIVLNYGNDRAMVTHPGAMEKFSKPDIDPKCLARARHLHLSSYFLQTNMQPGTIELFREARAQGLTTSLDVQWDPAEQWRIDLQAMLPHVDIFLPNETEALHLTGAPTPETALHVLAGWGHTVALKMGTQGSMGQCGKEVISMPPFLNTAVVDAIGAGDSFNAGFIFKFLQGCPLAECLTFGNLMGAVNTTQPGGTAAFTNYEEIMNIAEKQFGYSPG